MSWLKVYLLVILTVGTSQGWFFRDENEETQETTEEKENAPVPIRNVKFELKTTDEDFLLEARTASDLSDLDFCHHRVVAQLRSTCSELSEESMAKLSVQLLNCQSEAEGRPTFPCTQHMSIAECTHDMDAATWNAYQIVSNRARAICYQIRQQQFRMKTEHTVNHLVHTTRGQLEAMKEMEGSQAVIREAAAATLDKVKEGQQDLLERHSAIQTAQTSLHSSIATNLQDLLQEKALIAAGNKQLAHMATAIKHQLDEATSRLASQEQARKENHEEVLEDLASIRHKAREVWDKLDNSSQSVLQYHNETTQHYQETLENLHKVNQTVASVITTVHNLQSHLEEKLNWIASFLGGTGDRVALLWIVVLHLIYFLLAAISAAFLHTPMFSRCVLLLLVPLNAWSEIKQHTSLGFTAMTMFILLTVIANWLMGWMWLRYSKDSMKQTGSLPPAVSMPPTSPCSCYCSPVPNPIRDDFRSQRALSTPDLKKLAQIMTNMARSTSIDDTETSNGQDPVSEPSEPRLDEEAEDAVFVDNVGNTSINASLREVPHPEINVSVISTSQPTPVPDLDASNMPLGSAKMRADMVKRRLLSSPFVMREVSPSGSTTSTPAEKSKDRRRSRSRTPSFSKPLCTGFTTKGQPCKMPRLDGSDYCRRHTTM